MNHDNRGRLSIALGDGWRMYANTIPNGSKALGTVTRDGFDTGALIVTPAGIYCQFNAGASKSLPQSKVIAALAEARATHGGPGRGQGVKAADGATGLMRKNISIDQASIDTLRALGNGDLSLGIRLAASHLKSSKAL